MRDYGQVHTRFWTNPEVQKFTDRAKILALYLITGPHSNMIGCYRMPISYISEDLGWTNETVSKGLHELFQKGFVTHDKTSNWLIIHNFLKWNSIQNGNQGKHVEKLFEQVPEKTTIHSIFIDILLSDTKHLSKEFVNRLETLSQPFRNQDKEQEQDKDKEQEQDKEQETLSSEPSTVSNNEPPIILIPLNDKSEHPITQKQIHDWQQLYPIVDVIQELRNYKGWADANPQKRKTRSGILRSINTWLADKQNKGGHYSVAGTKPMTVEEKNKQAMEELLRGAQ